jgi:ABC-type transport system involved in cytochrome bd biosynthesis fused ATPase/permease subunit
MKFLGWTTTFLVLCLLVWLSATAAAIWLRALCTLLIAMIGLIAGLRIATRSTSSYIVELQRVNKVLCDQQHELEEVNAILLKQVSVEPSVESAAPSEGS